VARARNIKPAFFTNEDLVELEPIIRLLFIGLWTLADREGRLEDRPKRIKMALFPADDLDIDRALTALTAKGFIIRYEVGEARCIQVTNFCKHQSPHVKEQASTIPAPGSAPAPTGPSTGQAPGMSAVDTGQAPPDSLNPHSLNPDNPAKAGIAGDAAISSESGPESAHEPQTEPPSKVTPLRPVSLEPAPDGPFRLLQALAELTGFGRDGITKREKDKQAAVAKRLLEEGHTEDDVRGCIGYLLSEEWREGIVDLFLVERQIGKWLAAGRPASAGDTRPRRRPPNGAARDYEGTDWQAVKDQLEEKKRAKAT
jgi:hypothetical protein